MCKAFARLQRPCTQLLLEKTVYWNQCLKLLISVDLEAQMPDLFLDRGWSSHQLIALKDIATNYPWVKFHDCSGYRVWENASVSAFQDILSSVWPWPSVKIKQTAAVKASLLQTTILLSFMILLVIVSDKMSTFEFVPQLSEIFRQAPWPWSWLEATQTTIL